ncbi:sialic acid synthase [Planctomyces bekefii]|uniref:Sialic acid synthase n=1 Tax=Planctomyces bekefii TaxID=1653850 RepID=A0A5C6M3Y1_9PLAN|nr:sialic acid synthase [Planctomyces bekefii]
MLVIFKNNNYYMNTLKDLGIHTKSNVFIIAEIGLNHGGSLTTAKALIDSAVRAVLSLKSKQVI